MTSSDTASKTVSDNIIMVVEMLYMYMRNSVTLKGD